MSVLNRRRLADRTKEDNDDDDVMDLDSAIISFSMQEECLLLIFQPDSRWCQCCHK